MYGVYGVIAELQTGEEQPWWHQSLQCCMECTKTTSCSELSREVGMSRSSHQAAHQSLIMYWCLATHLPKFASGSPLHLFPSPTTIPLKEHGRVIPPAWLSEVFSIELVRAVRSLQTLESMNANGDDDTGSLLVTASIRCRKPHWPLVLLGA